MPRTKTSARQALLDAATTLLAENPGASFIEIAEAAGVGRASLYRHFPSREALLRELSLEAIRITDEAGDHIMKQATSASHALQMSIEAMVPLGDRFYFLTRLPDFYDPEVEKELQRQNQEMVSLIKAVQKEGAIDKKLPAQWAMEVFNGLIYAAWTSISQGDLKAEQASQLAYRTLLNGLSPKA